VPRSRESPTPRAPRHAPAGAGRSPSKSAGDEQHEDDQQHHPGDAFGHVEHESPETGETRFHSYMGNVPQASRAVCEIPAQNVGILR
jgi:hypothetical protein